MPLIPDSFNMQEMAEAQEWVEETSNEPNFRVGDAVFPAISIDKHLDVGIGTVEDVDFNHKNAGPFWFYFVKFQNDHNLWMSQSSLRRVAGV